MGFCALLFVLSCCVSKMVVEGVACGSVTLAEGESEILHHPNYPKNSPARSYCVSTVETSTTCNWLDIHVKKLDINNRYRNCKKEYVEIEAWAPGYTTRKIKIARGCHSLKNKGLLVRFPSMKITYRARTKPRRYGFLFTVTAVPSKCCETVDLTTAYTSLSMKTPGSAWHYMPKFFCYWKTQNALQKRVIDISCNSFTSIDSTDVFKFTYNGVTTDITTYTDLDGYNIEALENGDTEAYFISDENKMGDDVSCTITLQSTYKRFNSIDGTSHFIGSDTLVHSEYPNNYTGTTFYQNSYTIFKDNLDTTCYFKLTFDYFHIGDGASDGGSCDIDAFQSKGSTCSMPTVCGITTDGFFHFYMHVTDSSVDKCKFQVDVNKKKGLSYDRFFKFTLENIDCGAAHAPPSGCNQYYTASSGTVKSPMFQDDGTVVNAGLDYIVCIEQGAYTEVTWSVTPGLSRPFKYGDDLTQSLVDSSCSSTYIEMSSNKFCGGYFNPTEGETTNAAFTTTSFQIRIVTASSFSYNINDKSTWPNGFSLDYTLA